MEEIKEKKDKQAIISELIKKFNINIDKLKEEQLKFAKQIKIKDSINFELCEKIGGIVSTFTGNKIISVIVILNNELETVEQKYFVDRVKFPYIPEFRAYRELPTMISCYNKLEEQPDVIFIDGHGIAHSRLGLASHFSLAVQKPTIGIAKSLLVGDVKDDNIILNNKIVGKVITTKQGSNPVYVSPGNMISLDTAVKLTKKYIREPHKLPEPLVQATKYSNKIRDELSNQRIISD